MEWGRRRWWASTGRQPVTGTPSLGNRPFMLLASSLEGAWRPEGCCKEPRGGSARCSLEGAWRPVALYQGTPRAPSRWATRVLDDTGSRIEALSDRCEAQRSPLAGRHLGVARRCKQRRAPPAVPPVGCRGGVVPLGLSVCRHRQGLLGGRCRAFTTLRARGACFFGETWPATLGPTPTLTAARGWGDGGAGGRARDAKR